MVALSSQADPALARDCHKSIELFFRDTRCVRRPAPAAGRSSEADALGTARKPAYGHALHARRLHTGYPISLSSEERRLHIDIVGQSRAGKFTLLFNLMLADLDSNRDFVIEPHSGPSQQIAAAVPRRRTNDMVYFAPGF